jgi:hypothetical protein
MARKDCAQHHAGCVEDLVIKKASCHHVASKWQVVIQLLQTSAREILETIYPASRASRTSRHRAKYTCVCREDAFHRTTSDVHIVRCHLHPSYTNGSYSLMSPHIIAKSVGSPVPRNRANYETAEQGGHSKHGPKRRIIGMTRALI